LAFAVRWIESWEAGQANLGYGERRSASTAHDVNGDDAAVVAAEQIIGEIADD